MSIKRKEKGNFSITPGEGGEKRFGQAVQRRAGPVEWRG
jgi:hypothetical protein